MRFLQHQGAGVTFLAGTLTLRGEKVLVRPRLQPLELAADTVLMAVVRMESDRLSKPSLSSLQCTQAVEAVRFLADRKEVAGIQIDFDAVRSERHFYRRLLEELREQLPRDRQLSITALASWCMGDPWIRELPLDEAIPMLFRMGPDAGSVERALESGLDFNVALCRHSVGISIDEPMPALPPGRRLYVFNPHSWRQDTGLKVLDRLKMK